MQINIVSQQMIVGQFIILELLTRLSVGCLYEAGPGPAVVNHFSKNIRRYIFAPHDTQILHIKKIFPPTVMIDIAKGAALVICYNDSVQLIVKQWGYGIGLSVYSSLKGRALGWCLQRLR